MVTNDRNGSKLSRKERTYREHKASIMKAALDVFAQKGFRKTGMKDIAEHAEFGTGTIYNFFKNKQELFEALVVSYTEGYYEAACAALQKGETEVEQLRNYLKKKGDHFRSDLHLIRLFFSEGSGMSFNLGPRTRSQLQQLQERFIIRLTEVFRSGIERGIFKDNVPRHLAFSLEGQSNMYLFLWFAYAEGYEYPDLVEEILRVFLCPVAADERLVGGWQK